MTEKQKEGLRKQVAKQFSRNNRNWTYNGTYFEMTGDFGWRDLRIWATFRNKADGLEVEMQYRGHTPWNDRLPPVTERRFVGEDRFGQAFDAITDYLCRLAVVLVPVERERLVDMREYDEQIFALVTAIATDGK